MFRVHGGPPTNNSNQTVPLREKKGPIRPQPPRNPRNAQFPRGLTGKGLRLREMPQRKVSALREEQRTVRRLQHQDH